jgi:hypothetical protein
MPKPKLPKPFYLCFQGGGRRGGAWSLIFIVLINSIEKVRRYLEIFLSFFRHKSVFK